MKITCNVISTQVTGGNAKQLSDRLGKIMQDRSSLSINRTDISISWSKQLDPVVPPSKIFWLSSGEFVGAVGDNPKALIEQKLFHATILSNHGRLNKESDHFVDIPLTNRHGIRLLPGNLTSTIGENRIFFIKPIL